MRCCFLFLIFALLAVPQPAYAGKLVNTNRAATMIKQNEDIGPAKIGAEVPRSGRTGASFWKNQELPVQERSLKRYDRNRDGFLQSQETEKYLLDFYKKNYGSSRRLPAANSILRAYDHNGDGYISSAEMSKITQSLFE